MNLFMLGFLHGWEIVIILAVILLFFGARKLPDLARGLGMSIKEFKKATREDEPEKPEIKYQPEKPETKT